MGIVGWTLELFVNISVTTAIASRLWYMGAKVAHARSGSGSAPSSGTRAALFKFNTYASSVFTLVESGAILIAVTITMLTLYLTGNAAALMCTDIATQIAVSISFPTLPRCPCSTRRELTAPPPRAHRRSSRT